MLPVEAKTHLSYIVNRLRPRQDGRRFADDTFKRIFLNENVWFSIEVSLKFVPKGPINNIPALVQIMAWRRPGDKPLFEPMMVSLLTHICVTRPQWVNNVAADYQMTQRCHHIKLHKICPQIRARMLMFNDESYKLNLVLPQHKLRWWDIWHAARSTKILLLFFVHDNFTKWHMRPL